MGELDLGGAGGGGQVGLELGRVGHAHARKKKEGFGVCRRRTLLKKPSAAHARKRKEGSGVCPEALPSPDMHTLE